VNSLRALSIVIPLLLLGACGKDGPREIDTSPEKVADFSHPVYARGADPAWSLTVRGTQLSLSRPGQPDIVAQAPGAVIQPHQASWSATLPTGGVLKAVLYASDCPDAATGASDPLVAEVDLPGGGVLAGCAYRIK
jgi:uncharacterized membrane protein